MRYLTYVIGGLAAVLFGPGFAFAQEAAMAGKPLIGIGAGLAIGIAALGGTLGQAKVISSLLDATGRNPSASGKLFVPMIIGLVFIESLVILGFVIGFQLQGKL